MSDKLEALKEAALAATPGPWYRSSVIFNGVTSEQTFITQGNKPHIANAGEKRDAIFIAAASPDVAVLTQRNKELAERNAELEQRLQQPIKLPKREIGMACEFVSDHIVVSLAAVLVEAAAAGFKAEVEGE